MRFTGKQASKKARRYVLRKMITGSGVGKVKTGWSEWSSTVADVISNDLVDDEDFNRAERELKVVVGELRKMLAKT